MTDYALRFAEMAEKSTGIDDVHKAWQRLHGMYQTLGPVLASHDVFVCPTLNLPAVKADHDPYDPDFRVDGVRVDAEWGWVMTHQFNMLHNCPVMTVPSGKAKTGVPTGLQIVGPTFDDARVFRVAAAYEAAVGGWYRSAGDRPDLG
jgi:amidase